MKRGEYVMNGHTVGVKERYCPVCGEKMIVTYLSYDRINGLSVQYGCSHHRRDEDLNSQHSVELSIRQDASALITIPNYSNGLYK